VDVTATRRGLTGVLLLAGLVTLSGCGGSAGGGAAGGAGPPMVTVQIGEQRLQLHPTQYCLDGDGQRYDTSPPIVEALPDTSITLTVPDVVAEAGWSVQVFDEQLKEIIGEVDVDPGTAVLNEITTSDVVPPTFYLVVVEDTDAEACSGLSGAWPVGFIRAATASGTPPPGGTATPGTPGPTGSTVAPSG
jgi:hypothetical protein